MKIHLPPPRKPRIEMIPLIDIVFLLLVVFIYAMLAMAVHRSLPVTLPTSHGAGVAQEKAVLAVTVRPGATAGMRVFIDQEEVAADRLAAILRGRGETMRREWGREPTVQLFADSALSYQQLFQVLDRVRQAGLSQVALQAREEQ